MSLSDVPHDPCSYTGPTEAGRQHERSDDDRTDWHTDPEISGSRVYPGPGNTPECPGTPGLRISPSPRYTRVPDISGSRVYSDPGNTVPNIPGYTAGTPGSWIYPGPEYTQWVPGMGVTCPFTIGFALRALSRFRKPGAGTGSTIEQPKMQKHASTLGYAIELPGRKS